MTSDLNSKPLARWTIGNCRPDGFRCLVKSVSCFLRNWQAEVVICHNCDRSLIPAELYAHRLIDQRELRHSSLPTPCGVAWKLYPPRLAVDRHEIFIDNDLILGDPVPQLNDFFSGNHTLLLEENARNYGRFESHVPKGFRVNSGLFGLPPGFDFQSLLKFYAGEKWQPNALGEHVANVTWDEQGIVALSLLSDKNCRIVPQTVVANCEHELTEAMGFHFIGLNRREFHRPFRLYMNQSVKIY